MTDRDHQRSLHVFVAISKLQQSFSADHAVHFGIEHRVQGISKCDAIPYLSEDTVQNFCQELMIHLSQTSRRVSGMNVRYHSTCLKRVDLLLDLVLQSDWYSALRPGERFHLIVANPPYVASGDPHLQAGDLRFEPRLALEAGSVISSRREDPDRVLRNTMPVLDFLLGGALDDDNDLLARRRAVVQHLNNIRDARSRGLLAGRDDPEAFLAAARAYYGYLIPPPPSPEVRGAEAQA